MTVIALGGDNHEICSVITVCVCERGSKKWKKENKKDISPVREEHI